MYCLSQCNMFARRRAVHVYGETLDVRRKGRRLCTVAPGPPKKGNNSATTRTTSSTSSGGAATGKEEAAAVVTGKSMVIGAGAGLFGSFVGLGGGFIAIPSLTGWLRLSQHQAHGTSLGAVLATGAAGSSAYALSGHVDYRAATAMAIGGMAGAHVGARATARISPSILKLALGVLMIAVAPLLPLRDSFSRNNADPAESLDQSAHVADSPNRDEDPEDSPERSGTGDHDSSAARVEEKRSPTISSVKSKALQKGEVGPIRGTDSGPHHGTAPNFANSSLSLSEGENGNALIEGADCVAIPDLSMVLKMSAIGLGSGFLAGVFGVGGGVVTVPAISLTTDLSHKEVLGTSLAAMVIPALTGSVTHFRQGNLLPRVSVPLAVGTGLGAFFGGNYAARHLDDTSLKWAFAGIMLAMGARTVSAARAASVAAKATRAKF